jgi:hypothetical protein
LGVGALHGARGDQAAETAAEDDDAMGVGHGFVALYIRGKWLGKGCGKS